VVKAIRLRSAHLLTMGKRMQIIAARCGLPSPSTTASAT
jgi:hypothetical protein